MATTKSAHKSMRQNKKRKERNISYKKKTKGIVKEVKALLSQKEKEKAKELVPQLYKALDKSAKKGIIKKRTAGRRKSRITKMIEKSDKGDK